MRTFYFVGGPVEGETQAFFARLEALGGPPAGWRVYPHRDSSGRALHVVEAESEAPILAHLAHFESIYVRGPIIEVVLPDASGAAG